MMYRRVDAADSIIVTLRLQVNYDEIVKILFNIFFVENSKSS